MATIDDVSSLNKTPVTDEEELLELVVSKFTTAETFRRPYVEKWDRFYKYYRGYREKKSFPWLSNLFVPVAYMTVETLLPRIMATIFGPKFVVKILPREAADVEHAKLVEELLKYQFDLMGAFNKFYVWIKDMLLYGTAVMKVCWEYRTTKWVGSEPKYFLGFKTGDQQIEKTVVDYDGPYIEPIDLYDFYVDPSATDIKNADWCIQRVWRNYDYLVQKQKENKYKNIEKVKPGLSELEGVIKRIRAEVSGLPITGTEEDKYKVELLEYWENNRLIVVAQRSVIIRNETSNPYWHRQKPFVVIKDIEMPHEFYGIGEIEPIESLIHERNELRNQAMDNVKSIVNKVLIANRNADIDYDRLEENNRPGGVILTDDINALRYLEATNIVGDLYRQDAMLIKDIQDATAMAEWTIGVAPMRAETATAVMHIQQAAMTRFTLKIQNVIQNGIIELIRMLIAMNQQFLDKTKAIRILGRGGYEFPEISRADISGNYDLIPQVGLLEVNKDIERQQLLLLVNNPLFTLPNVNLEEFQKELLEKFGIKDADRFIRPMPVIPEDEILPGIAGRGVRAARRRVASGVPSVGNVPGVPVPRGG